MKKDVIYIDVEDDVTAIIGKIKKAEEKVVALVPPKRLGALQSAVNLRLINRMVKAEKKHLVLVTNNQALIGLAASSKIPVAKNLQTKPEVPEIAALIIDDDDDIIDGASIPVGEHAKTSKTVEKTNSPRSKAIESVDVSLDDDADSTGTVPVAAGVALSSAEPVKVKKKKVPNFDTFRKKMFLAIGGGAALIALLVWMFIFAPAATVVITASTSPLPVSTNVRLGGTAATSYEDGVISSVSQKDKIDATVEFEATGTGLVGDKAKGSVVFNNCEDSAAITIPSGTRISSGSRAYTTQSDVTVPGGSGTFFGCNSPGVSSAVEVVAVDIGSEFNTSSGTTFSVSGHSNSSSAYMRAVASTDIGGGSSKEVKVVSAQDIERARGVLIGESTEKYKEDLVKKFTNGERVIDSSFVVDRGKAASKPAVDEEAPDGKAVLSMEIDVSIQAIPKAELESFLKSYLESKMDDDQPQKVFDTGADGATIGNFQEEDDAMFATINSTGRIGPEIEEAAIKEQVKGLIYGEVQSQLEAREGIKEADVQFSYFWVRTVPNDTDKIKVEFKVDNE